MLNVMPRLMLARASNGFILVIMREDGPKLVLTLSKEHALTMILDEIDLLMKEPSSGPLIEPNGHEQNMQMLAKALKVPVSAVKDAMKEQIGIDRFTVFDEEGGA